MIDSGTVEPAEGRGHGPLARGRTIFAGSGNTKLQGRGLSSLLHAEPWCRLAVVEVPDVHYVRNGDVALAYQVFGDGPVELVYAPQWINNLEVAWGNPLFARFLNRLASFARVVFVDRRGIGLSIDFRRQTRRRWRH